MDNIPPPPPVSEPVAQPPTIQHRRAGLGLPLILFVLTCYSVYKTPGGLPFALTLMITLLAHEFGHFIQAMRYGVPASLPLFIPMPFSPIGTMGAVIVMQPGKGDRRAIFDIAITGPLAGLVFALIFSIVGLHLSEVRQANQPGAFALGEPLLFKGLGYLIFGPLRPGVDVFLHPIAFAGWVGIFITALNLIPIGQLDGGHILYALLLKKAHIVAQLLLLAAVAAVVIGRYWGWSLMLLLLMFIGPIHPPTANDDVPLGTTRTVLGWVTLMFVIIGFTPTPFIQ
jgi:membrane-associated protease RseP (regulator of RpoE activity)